jgi:hypothetical protein
MDNATLTSRTPEIDSILTSSVDQDVLAAVEQAIDSLNPGATLKPVGNLLRKLNGFSSNAGREVAHLPTDGLLGRIAERVRDLVALVWDLDDSYRALCAAPTMEALERVANDVAAVLAGHGVLLATWRS